ncbi:MAG: ABC transporter permease [Eubacterium sp.]|nr:ABC transporter permease [Eubacterium sp.]
MNVFLKYISKNMFEKKGRFFLLLFSIAISAGLLVASLGMVDIIMASLNEPYESGNMSDISIISKTDDPFMEKKDIETDGLKSVVYELQTTGVINKNDRVKYISLHGRKEYDGTILEGNTDFLDKKDSKEKEECVISKRIADEMNLKTGDTLKFYLLGEEVKFKISAISANEGMFYQDISTQFSLVVPYEYMNEKLGADGGYNVVYADVSGETAESFVKSFNNSNKDIKAIDLKATVLVDSSLNMGLYAMLFIVVVVSSIIIYGVFKLILTERLTVIGTFMSQGATKKKIERIILMEGLLYGLFGGAAGCAIGEVVLYYLGRYTSPLADYGIYNEFVIDPKFIVAGMIFACLLSVASAYFPVRGVRKLEVKDVILNRAEIKRGKTLVKTIFGLALIGFAIAVYFINDSVINITTPLGMAAAYVGIVLLVPIVVKAFTSLLCRVFKNQTTLYLTLNNLRSSKLLQNNIVLIVISLSSVLMISSFGTSMTNLVVDAYQKMRYDFSISGIMESDPNHSTTEKILDKLEETKGVEKESMGPIYYSEAKLDGMSVIATGTDIDPYVRCLDGYFGFNKYYAKDIKAFKDGGDDSIIITTKVAKEINKGVGDTVTIDIDSQEKKMKVVGIYDGKVYNGGISVLVKKDLLINEFKVKEASDIYFTVSGDTAKVEKELKPFLASLGATYSTKAEDTKRNDEQNQMIVMLLAVFSYLAMIIASIGVFNNITICFLQRKREMAVMASVGMNKQRRKRLILSESMISVVISILISIPFTILLSDLMTGFCSYIEMPMDVLFDWSSLLTYSPIIAGIIFIASLSTMSKSKKLSIVEELKYE